MPDFPCSRAAAGDWKDPLPDATLNVDESTLKESASVTGVLLLHYPVLLLTPHLKPGLSFAGFMP